VQWAIEILDTADANALVELAGLLGWGRSPVGRNNAPSGKTWQSRVAAVGSFGFKMTTSLWH
jgi:hypothetical protein